MHGNIYIVKYNNHPSVSITLIIFLTILYILIINKYIIYIPNNETNPTNIYANIFCIINLFLFYFSLISPFLYPFSLHHTQRCPKHSINELPSNDIKADNAPLLYATQ